MNPLIVGIAAVVVFLAWGGLALYYEIWNIRQDKKHHNITPQDNHSEAKPVKQTTPDQN